MEGVELVPKTQAQALDEINQQQHEIGAHKHSLKFLESALNDECLNARIVCDRHGVSIPFPKEETIEVFQSEVEYCHSRIKICEIEISKLGKLL